ncbi:broad-complex core protein-like isoform X1 [Microplitis mediator]|uniref:broad-complex core protein-like isoform X1 n=1 Tax=Microplitis mediator TaxID=375433 RepID=UPI002554783E|nr:broad-complex core protein-like isoform X1 [Microplitis mediator]XP_057329553.1 broad-complex core protein-like isoform X1 [Microplitis mediator]
MGDDDQQFCLRWNNHQTTLIQNFDTLLESGTLVDCTLAAEGKYLKAHKVVLSACSPYFEGLLSEHYDKHPVFILKDVKFKELKAMMDYMYRGEVNISQDQLAALLKAAESLQIKGLSESKTGSGGNTSGSSKAETRSQKTAPQPTAPSLDIPHSSSGLTIEKNSKVPRQSLAQTSVGDLPEDSASPSLSKGISSREGSVSPNGRKRKRYRRRSLNDDNPIDNHETSNSSDMSHQPMNVPAPGVAPIADEKSMSESADSLGRSALMQQLTKPADEMLQMPVEKPEPNDTLIEPKSEYLEDPEESVEDLTLDDDFNDTNDLEPDNNRAGPSHDSSHPGHASWHVTGDRSNAGGVVGSVAGAPGSNDEVFMAAQEAANAHRDSQGPKGKQAGKLPIQGGKPLIQAGKLKQAGKPSTQGGKSSAQGGKLSTPIKKSLPSGKLSTPSGKLSTPSGKLSTPSGKLSAQGGKSPAHSGKPSIPSGKLSSPSGKSSIKRGKPTIQSVKSLTHGGKSLPHGTSLIPGKPTIQSVKSLIQSGKSSNQGIGEEASSEPEFINEESLDLEYEELSFYEIDDDQFVDGNRKELAEIIEDFEEIVEEEDDDDGDRDGFGDVGDDDKEAEDYKTEVDDDKKNVEKIKKEVKEIKQEDDKSKVKLESKKRKRVPRKYGFRRRKPTMCQCDLCGSIYSWTTSLNRHRLKCEKIMALKKSAERADDDEDEEPGSKKIKMEKKPAGSSKYERVMAKYKSADGIYTCWDCGRRYHWASSLSRHRTIQCGSRNKRRYVCSLCGFRSGYKSNFLRHVKSPRHQRNIRFKKMQGKIEAEEITADDDDDGEDDEEDEIFSSEEEELKNYLKGKNIKEKI